MANFLSDLLTNAAAKPVVQNPGYNEEGRLRIKHAKAASTDYAQNDTLQLATFKKNQKVLYFILKADDFGTSVTADIGDGTDPNRFADGIDIATAAVTGSIVVSLDTAVLTEDITLTLTFLDANPVAGAIEVITVYAAP